MVAAKKHVKIVKKHTTTFNRHQSDRFKCVDPSWRKPKGIDNRVRRRFKGQAAMPKVRSHIQKKKELEEGLRKLRDKDLAVEATAHDGYGLAEATARKIEVLTLG
jgi:ribosomal protein L32E